MAKPQVGVLKSCLGRGSGKRVYQRHAEPGFVAAVCARAPLAILVNLPIYVQQMSRLRSLSAAAATVREGAGNSTCRCKVRRSPRGTRRSWQGLESETRMRYRELQICCRLNELFDVKTE